MITQSFQHFQPVKNTSGNIKEGKGGASGLLTGAGRSFNSLLGKVMSQKNSSEKTSMPNNFFTPKTIKGVKENSLMDSLLANIQLDGMSPGELEVDSKGIQLLEKLLENLGFGDNEIKDFMSDLTDGGTKDKLSLSGVLTKLNSFLKSGDSHDELAMSAAPGIESLLIAMGIDPQNVEKVLYDAGGNDGGIDLQNLIAGLKTISSEGNTGNELVMNTGNQILFSSLKLSQPGAKTVSLDDFIEKLEELVNKKNGRVSDGDTIDRIARSFGDSLKPIAEKEGGKGFQGDTNSFLNNHSFQKQQQIIEENSSLAKDGMQDRDSFKPEAVKFMMKDGAAAVTEQNLRRGVPNKQEDPGGASFKMGVAAESMTNRVTDSSVKLPIERPLPSYVANQVSMKIANAAKNGETEFKIQIKPPEMGRLQISLEFTKTGLKVGILAEHTATRDMLLSNSSELKSILNDQGIRLEKVQVDVSGNFDQSMADARRESGNSGNRNSAKNKTEDLFEKIAVDEAVKLAEEAYMRSETGRLNLVV